MKVEDLEFVANLVRRTSGLVLKGDKFYLLENRLAPLARQYGFENLSKFIDALRIGAKPELVDAVTEAMTTNETFFFRDRTPFTTMEEVVIPYLAKKFGRSGKVRLWTAAASSGQELYSIAILIREHVKDLGAIEFDLLGTDISNEVLEKAKSGLYSQFEVQRGLSAPRLVKNFEKEGELWRVKPEIRAMCDFRHCNLLQDFSSLGKFDIVFCRNVLIYFDPETKRDVLERIAKLMPDDGLLFLGAAETVVGVTQAFRPVKGCRGIYARNPNILESAIAA